MYLITWKEDDSIADFSNDIKYLRNGDPFIPQTNVSYPINCINVFAVDGVPEGISPGRYCYTRLQGFYENEDWGKPPAYNIDPVILGQIKDKTIKEIQQEVNENEFDTETTGTDSPA